MVTSAALALALSYLVPATLILHVESSSSLDEREAREIFVNSVGPKRRVVEPEALSLDHAALAACEGDTKFICLLLVSLGEKATPSRAWRATVKARLERSPESEHLLMLMLGRDQANGTKVTLTTLDIEEAFTVFDEGLEAGILWDDIEAAIFARAITVQTTRLANVRSQLGDFVQSSDLSSLRHRTRPKIEPPVLPFVAPSVSGERAQPEDVADSTGTDPLATRGLFVSGMILSAVGTGLLVYGGVEANRRIALSPRDSFNRNARFPGATGIPIAPVGAAAAATGLTWLVASILDLDQDHLVATILGGLGLGAASCVITYAFGYL
jgi:hypothetical protein